MSLLWWISLPFFFQCYFITPVRLFRGFLNYAQGSQTNTVSPDFMKTKKPKIFGALFRVCECVCFLTFLFSNRVDISQTFLFNHKIWKYWFQNEIWFPHTSQQFWDPEDSKNIHTNTMQIVETLFPLSDFASAQKNLVRVYQGARVGARSDEFS